MKEGLADYRYFPEPDLPGVFLTHDYVDGIRNTLPELPEMKRWRYEKMGLSMQDVIFLTNDINVRSLYYCLNACSVWELLYISRIWELKEQTEVEIMTETKEAEIMYACSLWELL